MRLKGDWEIIGLSDGTHTGVGEMSHNGDEPACRRRVHELFEAHVAGANANFEPTLEAIQALERGDKLVRIDGAGHVTTGVAPHTPLAEANARTCAAPHGRT